MFRLRLKELREEQGLSQYGLADALGVPQSTIGGWESGSRETKFSTLTKIADYFNVSIDYLLGHETKDIIKRPSAELMGEKEQNLLKMYKLMTERQQIEYYGIGIGMLQASNVDISLFVS